MEGGQECLCRGQAKRFACREGGGSSKSVCVGDKPRGSTVCFGRGVVLGGGAKGFLVLGAGGGVVRLRTDVMACRPRPLVCAAHRVHGSRSPLAGLPPSPHAHALAASLWALFLLLWLSIPSGFLVVFEKPIRSSFTFTTSTVSKSKSKCTLN
jgi:hypothetical protein